MHFYSTWLTHGTSLNWYIFLILRINFESTSLCKFFYVTLYLFLHSFFFAINHKKKKHRADDGNAIYTCESEWVTHWLNQNDSFPVRQVMSKVFREKKGMEIDLGWMQADICNKRCERMATLNHTHEYKHECVWSTEEVLQDYVCNNSENGTKSSSLELEARQLHLHLMLKQVPALTFGWNTVHLVSFRPFLK